MSKELLRRKFKSGCEVLIEDDGLIVYKTSKSHGQVDAIRFHDDQKINLAFTHVLESGDFVSLTESGMLKISSDERGWVASVLISEIIEYTKERNERDSSILPDKNGQP